MRGPVVITGAGSGLGRALAAELAQRDAKLILMDVEAEGLEVSRALCGRAAVIRTYAVDVADLEAMQRAAQEVEQDLGPPAIVFANAGRTSMLDVTSFYEPRHQAVIDSNFTGLIHTVGAFLPGALRARQGHFVGIGSLAGLRGFPRGAFYCATKAAQHTFLSALRFDVRPYNIGVSVVLPGFLDTPMNDPLRAEYRLLWPLDPQRAARAIVTQVAQGRRTIVVPRWLGPVAWLDRVMPAAVGDIVVAVFHQLLRRQQAATLEQSGA